MNTTIAKIEALNSLKEQINPTVIYNEGWMIRLLVMESLIQKLKIKNLDFAILATRNWSSEALIKSPFVGIKHNKENHTHADIILGDFNVDYNVNGETKLNEEPQVLGIIEAKMGSNLSKGTSNSKSNYNQASRSICCLSYITRNNPECELFFVVAAPLATINKYKIENQIKQEYINQQIKNRFKHSEVTYSPEIENQVNNCKITAISYEEWIDKLENNQVKKILNDFYKKCLFHNKIIKKDI